MNQRVPFPVLPVVAFVLLLLLMGGDSLVSSGGMMPGPRHIEIIRESATQTPEMARAIVNLRTGEAAKYLKEKSHSLSVVDPDAKDKEGNASAELAPWKTHIAGKSLPVVGIATKSADGRTGNIIHSESISATATEAEILAILKRHGG